uniref:Coactosin-like protein n=1 Tax=Caligus rogercresseyi TaxID=217165 RepID=C1BMR8_CALRO|nr:Coactosin-like protein [Caligus rogercresseyi]
MSSEAEVVKTTTPPANGYVSSSDEQEVKPEGFRKDGEPEYKPRKHNMATSVEKDDIRRAYEDVRSDTSDTEWAVFKFEGNKLGVTATGNDFNEFKSCFGNEDRGFGYIRIMTGDEMSKRSKFVLVTWVGPQVSVMKKAKMSTDKALMKDVIQNLSVELQLESHFEFNHDHFKHEVDRASGARYGTGVRDL